MSLRQIAKKIGISHVALRKWLLTADSAKYSAAQMSGLTQRIVEADEMLEMAEDAITIARAREIAKFSRWDAERRLPYLFGQRQEITHKADTGPVFVVQSSAAIPQLVNNDAADNEQVID